MVQIQIQSRDYCDLFYLFAADKHICWAEGERFWEVEKSWDGTLTFDILATNPLHNLYKGKLFKEKCYLTRHLKNCNI